ncbi:MAG TPA: MFS transporter [Sphingobium sp.]|nr:MFS transporter [Sphingobium sp.]
MQKMTQSLDRHGTEGRVWLPVVILCLNFGVVFFDRNALNFLMPFIGAELHLTNLEIGALAAALSLTWAVSGFLVGAVSDRFNSRKPLLIVAILCFSLCSILSGFATSFLTLFGARLLMGAAEGPILPLSQSLVAAGVPSRVRGMAMGIVQSVGSNLLGSFIAPIALVALAGWLGWRGAFYLAGLPGLICALAVWRFVDDPARSSGSRSSGAGLSLAKAFLFRNITICCILSTLIVGYLAVAYAFLPIYLTQVAGYNAESMSRLVSVLGLSAATGGFLVPALSDRFGRRPIMIAIPLLGAMLPLAALAIPASAWTMAAFFFVGWLIIGTLSLVMATIPSETVELHEVATALAIVMGVGEVCGGVGGPIIAGLVADKTGLGGVMWILALLALAASVTAMLLRETLPARAASLKLALADGELAAPLS